MMNKFKMFTFASILFLFLLWSSPSVCELDLSKCNKDFSCFSYPSGCNESCQAVATFQYNASKEIITIQLWAKSPYQYIGFGQKPINDDNYMIKIRGQYCYYNNTVLLGSFHGNLLDNPSKPEWFPESKGKVDNVNLLESSVDSDGSLFCRFERPVKGGGSSYLYDLTNPLLAAIALGKVDGSRNPSYHKDSYAKSGVPLNFLKINIPEATTEQPLPAIKLKTQPSSTLTTTYISSSMSAKIGFDLTKCNINFNCFRQPDGCSSDCSAVATFQYDNTRKMVDLQLWASSSKNWVGFGQRLPNELGNFMYKIRGQYCQRSIGNIPVFGSFNGNKLGPKAPDNPEWKKNVIGVTLLSAETNPDGSILCKFERSVYSSSKNNTDLYDMSSPLSAAIASGVLIKAEDVPGFHDSYSKSIEALNFTKIQDVMSKHSSNMSKKIHGVLMSIAWLLLVTCGIFVSRHMKYGLTEKVCGKECWFRLHQLCMGLAIAFIFCSIVIIAKDLNGWSQNPDKHHWFGLAAVVLCFFQPVFAFFRCSTDHEYRYFFTWIHRTVGILAWGLAVAAIIFGMEKFAIGYAAVVSFVATVVVMFIVLDIMKYYYESKHNYFPVIEGYAMDSFTQTSQEIEKPAASKQSTLVSKIFLVILVTFSTVITFYHVKVILDA